MSIPSLPIQEYAPYKLDRYLHGDKGALGDLFEVVVDTLIYPNYDLNHVHVAQLNKADKYGKGGSVEIGHNGKQWQFRKPCRRRANPRKVIYGVVTLDEFRSIVEFITTGKLASAQALVMERSAIFTSEDEYIDTMNTLTRGAGIKTTETTARGTLTLTIYNASKHKAFLKALASGTLTKFEGRA